MSLQHKRRQEVLDRDNRECQFCGVTEDQHRQEHGQSLEVHHLVPQREGGSDDPMNLISVCVSCHYTLEQSQAKAIERAKRDDIEKSELRERNQRLQTRVDSLLKAIHGLERILRDGSAIASEVEGTFASGDVVVERVGDSVLVTSDAEEATDAYHNWGSKIQRVSLRVDDAESTAADIRRRINIERRIR